MVIIFARRSALIISPSIVIVFTLGVSGYCGRQTLSGGASDALPLTGLCYKGLFAVFQLDHAADAECAGTVFDVLAFVPFPRAVKHAHRIAEANTVGFYGS